MNTMMNFLAPFAFLLLLVTSATRLNAEELLVTDNLNLYFSDLDQTFARLVEAGALRSTNLRSADRLFIREMRRNRSFFTFIRTNSKGVVISEVVRGEPVQRTMRDISAQYWFKHVYRKHEPYYSLIKDHERGRYYLFWARPILKQGDRFVGSVLLKIDLWDSFYEFSNDVYFPFLIKLGQTSLFSHKWKKTRNAKEEQLTINGIKHISVTYVPKKAHPAPKVSTPKVQDTTTDQPAVASTDMSTPPLQPATMEKNKPSRMFYFFFFIILLAVAAVSIMLITWIRRKALIRKIDEEDNL